MNGFYNLLIVDFTSKPFEVYFFIFLLNSQLNLPKWLWNKLFYLLSLVNTETECWCLTGPVSNRNFGVSATTTKCLLQRSCLKA